MARIGRASQKITQATHRSEAAGMGTLIVLHAMVAATCNSKCYTSIEFIAGNLVFGSTFTDLDV